MKKDFLKLSDLTRDEALKMLRKAADLQKKEEERRFASAAQGKISGNDF